jgi:hypothetical protein
MWSTGLPHISMLALTVLG